MRPGCRHHPRRNADDSYDNRRTGGYRAAFDRGNHPARFPDRARDNVCHRTFNYHLSGAAFDRASVIHRRAPAFHNRRAGDFPGNNLSAALNHHDAHPGAPNHKAAHHYYPAADYQCNRGRAAYLPGHKRAAGAVQPDPNRPGAGSS